MRKTGGSPTPRAAAGSRNGCFPQPLWRVGILCVGEGMYFERGVQLCEGDKFLIEVVEVTG
jgi:hypothetical protein